jgi:hypothetical protein
MMSEPPSSLASRGPYLVLAGFFEAVVEEKSGILTLVRLIDKIAISTNHPGITRLPPIPLSTHLVVSFRGQELEGSGVVSIQPSKPSGEALPKRDIPFVYDKPTGMNLNIAIEMLADQEGYYWFDIFLDGELITRTPLQIAFERATESEEQNSEGPAN